MSERTRILFMTNHMTDFTGSSFVILEFAQEFRRFGYEVEIACILLGAPMSDLLTEMGINAFQIADTIDPTAYGIIWSQHLTFGWIDLETLLHTRHDVRFVFSHLGPTEPLEQVLCPLELTLADAILFNSKETQDASILPSNLRKKAMIFYNAAPQSFQAAQKCRGQLKRVLYVSNHKVGELDEAVKILRSGGFHVECIGVHAEMYRRVLPDDIAWADTLISIGKTAIYGLVADLPIYIYGPHGGPGYLTTANFSKNARHNFSGRPFSARKNGELIASEIVKKRSSSFNLAALPNEIRTRYDLSMFTEMLLARLNEGRGQRISKAMLLQQRIYRNTCAAWRRSILC